MAKLKITVLLSLIFLSTFFINSDLSFAEQATGYRIVYVKSSELLNSPTVKEDLFLIDTDGSFSQLTYDGASKSPCISSDGNKIAFVKKGNIYVMNYKGKNLKQLTSGGKCDNPAFSPDGKKIAFVSEKRGIYVVSTDGSGKNKLYDLPGEKGGYGENYIDKIQFSSDSSKIYFLEGPGLLTAGNGPVCEVKGINISDGSGASDDIKGICNDFSVAGKKIAFAGNAESGSFRLGTAEIPADIGKIDVFSNQIVCNLSFSSDGKEIAYDTLCGSRERDVQESDIYIVDYNREQEIQLTFDQKSWAPSISGKIK